MAEKLAYPTCRQLLSTGRFCECPALHRKSFCSHHDRERQRQRNLAKARQLKEYTQPKRAAADPNFRPDAEFNAAVFDSIHFPTLEDTAAIAVAASNVARLLGAGYLSERAAQIMGNLIRIAELNVRKGNAFVRTADKPAQATDTDPVPPFGDDEGFVLPEETNLKRLHDDSKKDLGADEANEFRAALGNMPALIDELDPKYAHLPPMERGRAAYRDLREAINAQLAARKKAQAGMPVPQGESNTRSLAPELRRSG